MKNIMPLIKEEIIKNLNDEEQKIVKLITKKNSVIRSSKPKVIRDNSITGKAAYVWRMIAFFVSSNRVHQCMPVCAAFDLPAYNENGEWKSNISRIMEKELDILVKKIVDSFKTSELHGVKRWGKAFGYIS